MHFKNYRIEKNEALIKRSMSKAYKYIVIVQIIQFAFE